MDALPPDPYVALGVAKDATAAAIKAQYRKLVLRHHPDKVQDAAQKQSAADQFHKVQTAYEIVGDDSRRQRYDAQCKLAELKRDIDGARGYDDMRSGGYRMPPESARGGDYFSRAPERSGRMSPVYDERRPSFADYFDQPRSYSRKDPTDDRPSKRAPARDSHKKSRASDKKSKENERAEKSRRAEQETRREREKKYAYVSVDEDPSSDSDEYERRQRRMRAEDDMRRAARAEDERRREQEATASFFGNERAEKYFSQQWDAQAYIARGGTSPQEPQIVERRPEPDRKASSREQVETIKREGKPAITVRRGSGRPAATTRDSGRKSSSREKDIHIVDEAQEPARRPPMLNKMQSSPEHIRPPFERQRSNSLQDERRDAPPPPHPSMRRAETMPYPSVGSDSRRKDPAKHRSDARNAYPTPEATPEPPTSRKYSYGYAYAEDAETTSPDTYQPGFQPAYREPSSKPRLTRSPSPIAREAREKPRSSGASKYAAPQRPPTNKRTTSHSYVFPGAYENTESLPRPPIGREDSGRLFGEIQTSRSPRPSANKYSPPADDIRYSPKPRPEDIRAATGYQVRRSKDRPYTRNGQPIGVR